MKNYIYKMFLYLFLSSLIAILVEGDHSPVLIWSPSRSLKDLPQSYAGQTIPAKKFEEDYLSPLTSGASHNTVVFLQDKLSLEDFTHHADVYNPNSDGGAFKNIKGAMDDQFSVHLSAVKQPKEAIDTVVSSFSGEVHKVDNSDQLESLELNKNKNHLILVILPSTRGKEEAKAFAENDAMMGRCMHHLNKRDVKYSAIYTARSEAEPALDSGYIGRHLLADKDNTTGNGTFQNSTSEVLVFLKGVNLTAQSGSDHQAVYLVATDDTVEVKTSMENKTLTVNITIKDDVVSLTLEMKANESFANEWMIQEAKAVIMGKNDTNWTALSTEADLNLRAITAPYGFGFHCTSLGPVLGMTSKNETSEKNETKVYVTLDGFQFEPFYNHTGAHFGNDVWDCVPFFSVPIWTAIIGTSILMVVLFFALTMISNITTMDRFDDPKKKSITVNVSE